MVTNNDLRTHLASNFNIFLNDYELDEIIDIVSDILESKDAESAEGIAAEILIYLNKLSGRNFPVSPQNLKFINARLKEKNSPQLLKQIIEIKVFDWKDNFGMKKFLRPDTLFNPTKFEGYRQEVEDIKTNPTKFKEYVEQRNRQNNQQSGIKADPLDAVRD